MIRFSKEDLSQLLSLLGQELGIMKQMRELTENQADLLAADDIDAFDKSLESRQALIDNMSGLHQESDVLMQSYITFSKSKGGKKIDAVETAAEDLRKAIKECADINSRNAARAKEKSEEYSKQIEKLALERKSIGAYALSVPNDPEHFDTKT